MLEQLLPAYIGELGLNVIKSKLVNIKDECVLKKTIQAYAEEQFERVFQHACLSEEIDYGGLCEYLGTALVGIP